MFTLGQIKEAHAKVKSGADFPKYIQEIAQLGVLSYTSYVTDGHSEFIGADDHTAISEPKYATLTIAKESDEVLFRQYLKEHQQGQSNYPTFCQQSAETGTEKWIVDIINMTCTYYDKSGIEMLVEVIPSA